MDRITCQDIYGMQTRIFPFPVTKNFGWQVHPPPVLFHSSSARLNHTYNMGRKIFHIIHTRSFKSFPNKAPWQVLTALTCWLERYGFRCKIKNSRYSTGKERGFNVNNVAKFKLRVQESDTGLVITFEHYAKMKVRTFIAIGALTLASDQSYISTGFSVGTLGLIIEEADSLTGQFWRYADTLSSASGLIVEVKRWTSDGKGKWELETVYPVNSDIKLSNITSRSVIQGGGQK